MDSKRENNASLTLSVVGRVPSPATEFSTVPPAIPATIRLTAAPLCEGIF